MAPDLPAILLHGQPGGPGDWDRVVAAIGGRVRTIALTRPGYGEHPVSAGGFAVSARAALADLDAHGIERAVVVGHSWGGGVAAWLATVAPERVAGLVLVAAAANRDSLVPADRWLAAPVIGPLASGSLLVSSAVATQIPALRRRIAWAADLPPEYVAAEGRRGFSPRTIHTFLVEQRALLRDLPVLEERLRTIRTPTVVLVGAEDSLVPTAASERLAAQIPGARLEVIPHVGHVLNIQRPDRIAEAIMTVTSQASSLTA